MNFNKPYKPFWAKLFRFLPFSREELKKNPDYYEQEFARKTSDLGLILLTLNNGKGNFKHTENKLLCALRLKAKKRNLLFLIQYFFVLAIFTGVFISPFVIYFYNDCFKGILRFIPYFICYLLVFSLTLFLFVKLFEFISTVIKGGETLFKLLFMVVIIAASVYMFSHFPDNNNLYKSFGVSCICGILIFFITIPIIFLINLFIDLVFLRVKLINIEGLIIDKTYTLCIALYKPAKLSTSQSRNNLLNDIELLAQFIETDWPSAIHAADEHTTKWKRDTFSGIAASIRHQKKNIIIPSEENLKTFKEKMNQILLAIVKNEWASLVTEDVPAARIRKKSFWATLKSILVTFLPLAIYFCIKQFCTVKVVNEHYLPLVLLFSIIWTALNIMLWMDPEIANKLSAVKTAKSLFQRGGQD